MMSDGSLIGDPVGLDSTWLKFCDYNCPIDSSPAGDIGTSSKGGSMYKLQGFTLDAFNLMNEATINSDNSCSVDRWIPQGWGLTSAIDFENYHFFIMSDLTI